MRGEESVQLKAGIFVLLTGALLVAIVVLLGQRSQIFASQYLLRAEFQSAAGLIPGADVRLAGVTAGNVRSVRVEPGGKGGGFVEVLIDINENYQNYIRTDSVASIRTLGPLGDKYIEITLGSTDAAVLRPGDYIATREEEDFYELAAKARQALDKANRIALQVTETLDDFAETDVMDDLAQSAASMRRMIEATEKGPGLLHTLIFDDELPKALEDVRSATTTLKSCADDIKTGEGTLGRLIYGDDLDVVVADLKEATDSANRILAEIEEGDGTAHALIYGKDGADMVADIRSATQRLDRILAAIEEGDGTLGLLISDPEIWEMLKRALGGVEESWILRSVIQQEVEED